MDINSIKNFFENLKSHPLRTLLCVFFVLLITMALMWLGGYLQEKGRQGATDHELVKENQYIRVTKVTPIGEGKFAIIVEFGVQQTAVEGGHLGVHLSSKYTEVQKWFGPPYRTDVLRGGSVFFNSATKEEPPVYVHKFSGPSITPQKSYYLYFEGDEPLEIKDKRFTGYYE
jgi:hypothetical protein